MFIPSKDIGERGLSSSVLSAMRSECVVFFLKYSQICYLFLLFIYNFIYSLFIYSSYLFLVFIYISDLCRLPPAFSSNSLSLPSPLSSSTSSLSLSLVHVLSPFSSIMNFIY